MKHPRSKLMIRDTEKFLSSLSDELDRRVARCQLLMDSDKPLADKLMAIVIAMNGDLGKGNHPIEEALIANAIFKAWEPFLKKNDEGKIF